MELSWQYRRVLVAGGRGFIGKVIVRELQRILPDTDVQVVGRLGLDTALSEKEKWDVVVWTAGSRDAPVMELLEQHYHAPLRAMKRVRPGGRFVYLSSGQIYGQQGVPFREDAPLLGKAPYALAKIDGENALCELADSLGAEAPLLTIFRVSLAYGPGQRGPMLLPSLLDHLRRGEPFATTPAEQTRDFVHVEDIARAVVHSLTREPEHRVYNLASGTEVMLAEVIAKVVEAYSGDASKLVEIGALPYRENEQMRYCLSIDRLRESLGFVPSMTIDSGIATLLANSETGA